jgi:hypothetical protein
MPSSKYVIDAKKNLSIIVLGLKLSDTLRWVKNHDIDNLPVHETVLAYCHHDQQENLISSEKIKTFQGSVDLWQRLKSSLAIIKTPFVKLTAADDSIGHLNFQLFSEFDFIAGSYFFTDGKDIFASTTNSIEFNEYPLANMKAFWSHPNPGDASFLWGSYRKSFLFYILESSRTLDFEAADWYILTRVLRQGRAMRDPADLFYRSTNPKDKYVNRVVEQIKKRMEIHPFETTNPILFCAKEISLILSKEEFSLVAHGLSTQIYFKFLEVQQAAPDLFPNYTPDKLAELSVSLIANIYHFDIDQFDSYSYYQGGNS